ncbi:MAG: S8 family serine peptidase [Phycisphaerales bacterium]|nr:S8 family serine peptidase [Phycisphaerales bacterium]
MRSLMLVVAGGLIATSVTGADTDTSIIPDSTWQSHEYVPNALLMRFREGASEAQRDALLAEVGGSITEEFWLVPGLARVDTRDSVPAALATLGHRSDVLHYVEPVFVVRSFETIPNDPYYSQLYGMPQVRAHLAWDDHVGDQDFVVAIIDTGLDYNHEDIQANAWTNPGEIAGNGQDDDGNGYVDDVHGYDFVNGDSDPYDDNSHGTHCGGTIAGKGNNGIGVTGVSWHAQLVGVKFLSGGGSGSTDGAIQSVQYCAANAFKVSNNSWGGGGYTQGLFDAIQAAGDNHGHVFVAAAGNGGSYGASYPAAYTCTNIIAVAASDSNENPASFTQYHPVEVDIAAPGVDVISSVPGNGYSSYSGTSMATPHVCGGVALVYSLMGDSSAEEVRDIILSTARPVGVWDGMCASGGILDVDAALDATFLGPKFELLSSVPMELDPNTQLAVQATLDPREDVIVPGSVQVNYRNSLGGWSSMAMDSDGVGGFTATVPGYACDQSSGFYLSCQGETSGLVTIPAAGATSPFAYIIGQIEVAYSDNGQSNGDWTVETSAADGGWNRGVPINCDRGDPPSDFDGSGACWLTDNSSSDGCNSDVDEGATLLTSGVIDISSVPDGQLSYARWFHNSYGAAPNTDTFVVQIRADGGSWSVLEEVGPSGSDVNGGWVVAEWDLADVASGASTIQLRFTASDIGADTQSVVEAGVDAVTVTARICDDEPFCPGDLNGDMVVDVNDVLTAVGGWGTKYNVEDLLTVLAQFGDSC